MRRGLERSGTGPEASSLGLLGANIHLLLGLTRQILVLGRRVILP